MRKPYYHHPREAEVEVVEVFGVPVYQRVGVISLVRLFGCNVYQRVGEVKSLFGICWGGKRVA